MESKDTDPTSVTLKIIDAKRFREQHPLFFKLHTTGWGMYSMVILCLLLIAEFAIAILLSQSVEMFDVVIVLIGVGLTIVGFLISHSLWNDFKYADYELVAGDDQHENI